MSEFRKKKYKANTIEQHWGQEWENQKIYRWDSQRGREETFVVDSPPPTVSGSLHVGHVFSYTHQDLLVRYQRMQGKNICYPMGWDDNGLPTERRVQNLFGTQCNPHLPYDPDYKPVKATKKTKIQEVSRRNFIESCTLVTEEDEATFEHLWRRLGLSIDWTLQYSTIGEHARKTSQYSFLDLVEKDLVYSAEAPTMWDIDFQTAVAQAEVEDRPRPGLFHDIRFQVEGGGDFVIGTTRPELLPACIAVVAHPEDERYQDLFGKYAITPLFEARVPILASEHAEPDKGTGILMVCTFGDAADVDWWKQSNLPLKQVIGRKGTMIPVVFGQEPFNSLNAQQAQKYYDQITGLYAKQAKKQVATWLAETLDPSGQPFLVGEPKPTEQAVKYYEKGDRPLEFVPTRQWFVKILDHKEALLEQGKKVQWHPSHMRVRYDHWVEGLNQDWCISRQRYFGVSFPVWYPLDEQGEPNYDQPIFAKREQLPVDPLSACPEGYSEAQRNVPNGFTGDPDVMDTWATSSLTPQIVSHWGEDEARHHQLFPSDIRPQSHEIIRTWAFYTIVKAYFHEQSIPWNHVVISGWILDKERKKMSKSKGNVVTPEHLLDEYSSDAVRYWAGRARLGADTAFDPTVFKIGKKLCTKVFNASKFVLGQLEEAGLNAEDICSSWITNPVDLSLVAKLNATIKAATEAFESFEYSVALQATENFFWDFCDNYLELTKKRSYDEEDSPGKRSALATLSFALKNSLQLLAPFIPYVTEEVWSWYFNQKFGSSIHTSQWPVAISVEHIGEQLYLLASEVLSGIRSAKTKGQVNLRWPISSLTIHIDDAGQNLIKQAWPDIALAGHVQQKPLFQTAETLNIVAILADSE